ncbi:MAG: ATPase, T2SS/T4P/T4SS family [Candidatus Hadarchaeales archaeon]
MALTNYTRSNVDKEAIIHSVLERIAYKVDIGNARSKVEEAVSSELRQRGVFITQLERMQLIDTIVSRLVGWGPLEQLLPPKRTDLIEIAVTPDGKVWVLKKGERTFEEHDLKLTETDVWRFLDAILGAQGKSLTEATPSVDAQLPPTPDNPAGGRIKALHPCLVGGSFPAVNIRLFEARPVMPEQIVAWGEAPQELLDELGRAIKARLRILIGGGTATGKTTLLSALCNYIPRTERIIKIEDPPEIFIDHPHVVTIAARPMPPGSIVPAYTVKDGVDDALRMRPDRLIVGEVRKGDAALALFRAQMSDHAGLSTFHADSPHAAQQRLSLIMFADAGIRTEAAKGLFAQAIDIYVQLGFDEKGVRRVMGVWQVEENLKGGDVVFTPIWRYSPPQNWQKVGEISRRREV